ncbi:MAG: hypothetical protein K2X01_11225 [Cyanobacteria bacterium]|nr:hypothetical protein [Cyanobacteriota bacterium]
MMNPSFGYRPLGYGMSTFAPQTPYASQYGGQYGGLYCGMDSGLVSFNGFQPSYMPNLGMPNLGLGFGAGFGQNYSQIGGFGAADPQEALMNRLLAALAQLQGGNGVRGNGWPGLVPPPPDPNVELANSLKSQAQALLDGAKINDKALDDLTKIDQATETQNAIQYYATVNAAFGFNASKDGGGVIHDGVFKGKGVNDVKTQDLIDNGLMPKGDYNLDALTKEFKTAVGGSENKGNQKNLAATTSLNTAWHSTPYNFIMSQKYLDEANKIRTSMSEKGITDSSLSALADQLYDRAKKHYQIGVTTVSPLVFDLKGDGVKTTGMNKSFDINGDGKADQTAWAGAGQGVLAFDGDGDGKVGTSGRELFGNFTDVAGTGKAGNFANGYEALKALAAKVLGQGAVADGKLDAKEIKALEQKTKLSMLVDGQSKSLTDLGISEINLGYSEKKAGDAGFTDENGNEHRQSSAFVLNGQQRQSTDVWFKTVLG